MCTRLQQQQTCLCFQTRSDVSAALDQKEDGPKACGQALIRLLPQTGKITQAAEAPSSARKRPERAAAPLKRCDTRKEEKLQLSCGQELYYCTSTLELIAVERPLVRTDLRPASLTQTLTTATPNLRSDKGFL
ncbi:hypothetical protein SRHO_G00033090 [Serrasalmus rhombeus]